MTIVAEACREARGCKARPRTLEDVPDTATLDPRRVPAPSTKAHVMISFANEKTLGDLEWPALLTAIAERCAGASGQRRATELPFAASADDARRALAEVSEAFLTMMAGEPLPLYGLRDVEPSLDRLGAAGVLAPRELVDVGRTLGSARVLRRFTKSREPTLPHLARACATDPTLDRLEDEITGAFDADGTLADHASPRLRELRGEFRTARARMVSRMEELMRQYAHILSDGYWTEREGRYVLPVRTDAHERFPGLVHTTSASGSTLFVEPRVVIPIGNRLKVLEGEVRREEEAIYARLSGLLTDALPSVAAAFDALSHADVRAASAKLARDADLRFVPVLDEPVLELSAARHPLLVLAGVAVVPSDLRVSAGHAVVISGPNAGGKTVSLKTLGLVALMVRAGLPVPADEASRIGLFENVLTDVGDEQSLQKNLSTFSAHVKNLAHVLTEAGRGALVLLDEVATGTDPREGEALAAAVLDSLCRRGAAVVATTHYEGLKTLALGDERFQNASVGFDVASMSPTFRLAFGLPGASSALSVARRFGVPEDVLARAESFLSREDRDFDDIVKQLHDERRALELARSAAEARERQADERATALSLEIERVRARQAEELTNEVAALREQVRKARDELRAAVARVRGSGPNKKVDAHDLALSERAIDEIAAKVALGGELSRGDEGETFAPLTERDVRKGARVYVARLRSEAEIVEVLAGGKLRVAAGPLKLTVGLHEITQPRKAEEPAKPKKTTARTTEQPAHASDEGPVQTSDNTCDLRGMRVAEALSMATQFLDRAVGTRARCVFFVHGQGTGALREALRDDLAESSYVRKVAPGGKGEGGDGVTIAWMR